MNTVTLSFFDFVCALWRPEDVNSAMHAVREVLAKSLENVHVTGHKVGQSAYGISCGTSTW